MRGPLPPRRCANRFSPAVWLCKIAKTAARARRQLHRREAGRRFCAIVDASALSRAAQPAAVSGDWQVNPLFSRKMLPLTRAAADIRLRFWMAKRRGPQSIMIRRTPHDEY